MPERFEEESRKFLRAYAAMAEAKRALATAEGELVSRMETYRITRFVSLLPGVVIERGFGESAHKLSVTPIAILERP